MDEPRYTEAMFTPADPYVATDRKPDAYVTIPPPSGRRGLRRRLRDLQLWADANGLTRHSRRVRKADRERWSRQAVPPLR
jgi:hypothetical protein